MQTLFYRLLIRYIDTAYAGANIHQVPEIAEFKKCFLLLNESKQMHITLLLLLNVRKLAKGIMREEKIESVLDRLIALIYPGPKDEKLLQIWIKTAKTRYAERIPAEELIMAVRMAEDHTGKKEVNNLIRKSIMQNRTNLSKCKNAKKERMNMFGIFKKAKSMPETKATLMEYQSRMDMIAMEIRNKEDAMHKILEKASSYDVLDQRINHDRYKFLKKECNELYRQFDELGKAIDDIKHEQLLEQSKRNLDEIANLTVDPTKTERTYDNVEALKATLAEQHERMKEFSKDDVSNPVLLDEDEDDEFMQEIRKNPEKKTNAVQINFESEKEK